MRVGRKMNSDNNKDKLVNGTNNIDNVNMGAFSNQNGNNLVANNIQQSSSVQGQSNVNNKNEIENGVILTFQIPPSKSSEQFGTNSVLNGEQSNVNKVAQISNSIQNKEPDNSNDVVSNFSSNIVNNSNPSNGSDVASNNSNISNNNSGASNSNINRGVQANYLTSMINDKKEEVEDEEELVRQIIGEKYYKKYTTKSFNFVACIFPLYYMYYTGIFFWGYLLEFIASFLKVTIYCIIQLVLGFSLDKISYLVYSIVFLIASRIVFGFSFNKLYVERVRRKVRKLKSGVGGMVYCSFSGWNIFKGCLIGCVISILLSVAINRVDEYVSQLPDDSNSIIKKVYDAVSEVTEEEFDINDIAQEDESINIYNLVEVNIPSEFSSEGNYSYKYSYSYDVSSIDSSTCSMSISAVYNYSDEDELLDALELDYKNKNQYEGSTTVRFSSNNDDWKYIVFMLDGQAEYYYTRLNNGTLYLFTYIIEANASDSCAGYREEILESIVFK